MDGESVSISIVNDICKEGVVNGAAEEEEVKGGGQ